MDNETIGIMDRVLMDHDEKWEGNYTFTPEKMGENMKLEFLLYREPEAETYRRLQLFVSVKQEE